MLVGRRIWYPVSLEGLTHMQGPLDVKNVAAVYPQGPILDQDGKPTGTIRDRSLVKIYTDPGGYRVVTAAEIWGKDPGRSDSQW